MPLQLTRSVSTHTYSTPSGVPPVSFLGFLQVRSEGSWTLKQPHGRFPLIPRPLIPSSSRYFTPPTRPDRTRVSSVFQGIYTFSLRLPLGLTTVGLSQTV